MAMFKVKLHLSILILCLWLSSAERDFQFENVSSDGTQITLTEAPVEHTKPVIHKPEYAQEVSQCPYSERRIILSLVLKSLSWDEVLESKKSRALKKLSKFFAIPKEYIHTSNASPRDLYKKSQRSITRGRNKCEKDRTLGKIEFMIGCGSKYFASGEPISNQIGQQMRDGSINEFSGLDFGWWVIWNKTMNNRVQRYKRETADGSGDGEGDDYEYDYESEDDEDDDDEEMEHVTEIPAVTTHAHRHHHGIPKPQYTDISSKKTETSKQSTETNAIEANKKHKKNELKPLQENTEKVIPKVGIDDEIAKSVFKLESDITKTIENTKRFKDTALENVEKEVKGEGTDTNALPVDSKEPSVKKDANGSKSYEDYVIEDFATELAAETTPIISVNTATTPNSKLDSTFTKETTTEIQSTTAKAILSEHTTPQSTTVPTTTKKSFEETSIVAYTEEIVTNIENRTAKPSAPSTEFTTTMVETTELTTTFASIITRKNTEEEKNVGHRFSGVLSTLPTSVDLGDDDDTGDEDDIVPETTTILPEIEETHVELTPPTTTTTTTAVPKTQSTTPATTSQLPPTTTTTRRSTTITTTTTTTTTPLPVTTEEIEVEPANMPPMIKNRLPKQPVTAGKPFSLTVPAETFYDNEDGSNLRLELFDKNGNDLKGNSWIQFDSEKREIYGLPLEDAVSRWQYKLVATDSKNESVTETLDISVQQHKGHRSVNHEITIAVKLNKKFQKNIDWQIRLIRGIVETLNDNTMSSVVVREIRQSQQDPHSATFIYTNETLPKDKCPEEKLDELIKRLDYRKLTDSLLPELSVKSVTAQPIGPCQKPHAPKPKPTPHMTKNYPPVPRNQVDRVNATIGHLLVYKVPSDTFYDPEDTTDLKLSLLTIERSQIKPTHWLQFDSKNQEFFGIPKSGDIGSEEYLLVAEDHEGLQATDALVVVVNQPPKREYSVLFKVTLGIRYDAFTNAHMQRKFIERLAQLFGDPTPANIQIRSIQHLPDGESIMISFYNTTLVKVHHRCPAEDIEMIRNIWYQSDTTLKERVKKVMGNEFNIIGVTMNPLGNCNALSGDISHERIPIKTEDRSTSSSSSFKDDYLLTFILPAILILAMVLLASIIACVLHRRRLTGKMELGDEEERRSFRSKGIPVIFQDELDEKPEIGNKSPIILKDEKPPLLPPSYNSTNLDGDNDVDEYVPPPAVMGVMGGRETRGKSPVTPSYRKPPPYVSP